METVCSIDLHTPQHLTRLTIFLYNTSQLKFPYSILNHPFHFTYFPKFGFMSRQTLLVVEELCVIDDIPVDPRALRLKTILVPNSEYNFTLQAGSGGGNTAFVCASKGLRFMVSSAGTFSVDGIWHNSSLSDYFYASGRWSFKLLNEASTLVIKEIPTRAESESRRRSIQPGPVTRSMRRLLEQQGDSKKEEEGSLPGVKREPF